MNKLFTMLLLCCLLTSVQADNGLVGDGLDDDAITQGLSEAADSYWTKSRSINNVKYEIVSIERIYELPPRRLEGASQSLRHFSVLTTLKETQLRKDGTKTTTEYVSAKFDCRGNTKGFTRSGVRISLDGWSTYEKYQEAISAYDNSKTSRIIYPENLRQEKEGNQVPSHWTVTNSFSITPYFLVSRKNFNEAIIERTKDSKEVRIDLNKLKPIQGQVSGSKDCKDVYLQWEGKIFEVFYETQSNPSYVCCYYRAVTIMLFDPQKKTQIWKDVLMLEEQNNTTKQQREIVADGKLVIFNKGIMPYFYNKGEMVTIFENQTQTNKTIVKSVRVDFETFK
jgi:hypothetical protein